MRIGILQCGHVTQDIEDKVGDFDQMFRTFFADQGFEFQTWNVVDMDFPTGPDAAEGWIVTGSKHGAYEDHAFIPPLEGLIRAIHDSDRRMIGICFGHQIIAKALGGHVEKVAKGWGLGHQSYTDARGGTIRVNAWHQDQVVKKPAGAKVWASNDFCENAGLLYGQRAWTLQPHPEFDPWVVQNMASTRKGTLDYPDNGMDSAHKRANDPTDRWDLARDMGAFLKGDYQVPA